MEDRKLCKGRDEDQYRALDRRIRKACDEAKEAWMNQQCEVIEDLQRHHNYAGLHQKVREITGKSRRNPTGCIKDNASKQVMFYSTRKTLFSAGLNTLRSCTGIRIEHGINRRLILN